MNKFFPLLLAGIFIAGCGGGGSNLIGGHKTSTITGVVYDTSLNPVTDASVTLSTSRVFSSTSGAWILTNQPDGYVTIHALAVKNGVSYVGETQVYNTAAEQTTSVGIMVAPTTAYAEVTGNVTDQGGDPLENIGVFAYNSGGGTSIRAFTDSDGNYDLGVVPSGMTWKISATGQNLRADQVSVTPNPGDQLEEDFVLGPSGTPSLVAPTSLSTVTYVSDASPTAASAHALDWVKQHFDPKVKHAYITKKVSRSIRTDLNIEAQLDWVYTPGNEDQGFGIYRSAGTTTHPASYDFFYDPLTSTYYDAGLNVNSTYSYGVTSTSTNYPDGTATSQSALSNVAQATTLNRLALGTFTKTGGGTGTFTWNGGSGATSYIVYIFSAYPNINETAVFSNESSPTTSTSYHYAGTPLAVGSTYYWLVVGLANGNASRTISQVGSFKP